jgi:signal recognition particle receptor subunit beta
MSDDQPEVPVVCTECDTRTQVPLDDVAGAVERHNEQLHDGEEIAEVDPAIREHLADRIAKDIGLLD